MKTALLGSVAITLLALLVFGYVKGRFTVKKPLRSAWQTALVGGLAAAAAFAIAKAIGSRDQSGRYSSVILSEAKDLLWSSSVHRTSSHRSSSSSCSLPRELHRPHRVSRR
jgi:hypothetical protein